jgi:hypothetical protein
MLKIGIYGWSRFPECRNRGRELGVRIAPAVGG